MKVGRCGCACVKVGGCGCTYVKVCGCACVKTDKVSVPLAHVYLWSSVESRPSVGRHSSSHTPVPPSRPARTGPVQT